MHATYNQVELSHIKAKAERIWTEVWEALWPGFDERYETDLAGRMASLAADGAMAAYLADLGVTLDDLDGIWSC
jgi:hypothetical protein